MSFQTHRSKAPWSWWRRPRRSGIGWRRATANRAWTWPGPRRCWTNPRGGRPQRTPPTSYVKRKEEKTDKQVTSAHENLYICYLFFEFNSYQKLQLQTEKYGHRHVVSSGCQCPDHPWLGRFRRHLASQTPDLSKDVGLDILEYDHIMSHNNIHCFSYHKTKKHMNYLYSHRCVAASPRRQSVLVHSRLRHWSRRSGMENSNKKKRKNTPEHESNEVGFQI